MEGLSPLPCHGGHGPEGKPFSHLGRRTRKKKEEGALSPSLPDEKKRERPKKEKAPKKEKKRKTREKKREGAMLLSFYHTCASK